MRQESKAMNWKNALRENLQANFEKVTSRGGKPKLPPPRVIQTIDRIRTGFSKIQKKMVPAPVALLEMVTGQWSSRAISVAASLGVADHIGENGASIEELAEKCGADTESLYRLLRALTVVDVFTELSGRRFKLTSIGKCLRTDHPQSMRHVSMFQGALNWQHWGELEYCVRTGKNAVEKVWGEKPFEHLAKHPEKAAVFDRAMTNISAMEIEAIVAAYDFSGFGVIADIGGGHGKLLSAVLKATPDARGMLFDLPHVVEGTKAGLMAEGLSARVETHTGSFFETIPAGADAYMMKHIIHDWSDAECVKILKNVRAKIPSDGKLLVLESIVPKRNVPHFAKFLDLEMLVVTTGKERTEQEYRELLERAEFRLTKVVQTIGGIGILEAVPV